jgi:hypothetical protein
LCSFIVPKNLHVGKDGVSVPRNVLVDDADADDAVFIRISVLAVIVSATMIGESSFPPGTTR